MSVNRIPDATWIFQRFLEEVVQKHVFSKAERDYKNRPMPEQVAKAVMAGKRQDSRSPWLMRVSGKGGWIEGQGFEQRSKFRNVTLLDHLASVTRGALVIAELDLRASGTLMPLDLRPRLAKIASAAFLHDVDKMLDLPRSVWLNAGHVAEAMQRYGIDTFLSNHGAAMEPLVMLSWIEEAETTRSGRMRPDGVVLSVQDRKDAAYVRLADRMDGTYLSMSDGDGVQGALQHLASFADLRTDALRAPWSTLAIRSPHTPFILDKLQGYLSSACRFLSGLPPLVEVHQDGELVVVVPTAYKDLIIGKALDDMAKPFSDGTRVNVNNRLAIEVLDDGSRLEDVVEALRSAPDTARKTLSVLTSVAFDAGIQEIFGACLMEEGTPPLPWPDPEKAIGKTTVPLLGFGADDRIDLLNRSATLVTLLRCAPPEDKTLAKRTLTSEGREKQLAEALAEIGVDVPQVVQGIKDDMSRRALLSIWVGAITVAQDDIWTYLTGQGGVVRAWAEGSQDGTYSGIFARIQSPSQVFVKPVKAWLDAALLQRFVAGNDALEGRCHFTAIPASPGSGDLYQGKDGLYGLNVTAFSGRSGRPEPFGKMIQQTLVSPIARAEHKLRALDNGKAPASAKMAVMLSCSTTGGLFASLGMADDLKEMRFSSYDVLRLDHKVDKLIFDPAAEFARRPLIGRLEEAGSTMADHIAFVARVLSMARRSGKAVHVFRGLPETRGDFVFYDAMPAALVKGLGGQGLRLEQLDAAIQRVELWREVIDSKVLDVDVATRLMEPATRLGAAADAITRLERSPKAEDFQSLLLSLRNTAKESMAMSQDKNDNAIVAFARAMSRYQKRNLSTDSVGVKEAGIRGALEALEGAIRIGQTHRESLIAAVVASIEENFRRASNKAYAGEASREGLSLSEALHEAARVFVDEVWIKALRRKDPTAENRRIMTGIYRVAFDIAHDDKKARQTQNNTTAEESAAESTLN